MDDINRRVLLIDDDIVDQKAFERFVKTEKLSYNYKIAGSISEAKNILNDNTFDIIILDFSLGDGTGLDILKLKLPVPIIVATGTGDEEIAITAIKMGAYDYIIKGMGAAHLKMLPLIIENTIMKKQLDDQITMLSQAFRSTEECIYITNLNGVFLFVNDAFCKTYGYTEDEILGAHHKILWKSDLKNEEKDNLLNDESNQVWKGEYYHLRKDGTEFPVSLSKSLVKDEAGNRIATIGISSDITERKKAEALLKKNKENLLEAQQIAHLGSWEWNLAAKTITYSEEMYNIFELQDIKEKITYKNFLQSLHSKDIKLFRKSIYSLLRNKPTSSLDYRIKTIANNEKIVNARLRVLYDDANKPSCVIGTVQDVTERKTMEEELRRANSDKDKFFSIISHDLKGPLHSVVGFSEILAEDYSSLTKDEIQSYIKFTNESAAKLMQLTNNLLEWATMQKGRINYNPVKINVRTISNTVIDILTQNALKKKITIKNNIDDAHFIFADKNMIQSVFHNLINNAIKFTKTGGVIALSLKEKDNYNEITVQDSGVGINKNDIDKLFRIDVHQTSIGTSNEKGTGLGLILCKEFVETNGGKIWVNSELDKGTAFSFTLPKYTEEKTRLAAIK